MAGKRRKTGRPLRSVERLERRQAAAWERLQYERSPMGRLAAALDFLRTVLAQVDADVRQRVCDRLVQQFTSEAQALIEGPEGSE